MIVDTEFEPGECPDIDEDADQDSINSRGIYDLSIVVSDHLGNVIHVLFHERNGDYTPLTGATMQHAISILRGNARERPAGLCVASAPVPPRDHPRLVPGLLGQPRARPLFRLAGRLKNDGSDGVDVRTALAAVVLTCRPSGLLPFSLSQNLIVPFLGIREGPLHTALQDTYDEAVTITSILRGAVNRHFTATAQPKKKQWLISDMFQ